MEINPKLQTRQRSLELNDKPHKATDAGNCSVRLRHGQDERMQMPP